MPNRSINHRNGFSNLFFEQSILQFWAPPWIWTFDHKTKQNKRVIFLITTSIRLAMYAECCQFTWENLNSSTPYFLRWLFTNLKIVSVPYPLLKSQKIENIIWQWQAGRSMDRTCQLYWQQPKYVRSEHDLDFPWKKVHPHDCMTAFSKLNETEAQSKNIFRVLQKGYHKQRLQ